VAPLDVSALRLHWRVRGTDRTYTQRTPFVRWVDPAEYYAAAYYYPPGYYGAFDYPFPCWPAAGTSCVYTYAYGLRTWPAVPPVYVAPTRRITRTPADR
jgi:hypothetical protein